MKSRPAEFDAWLPLLVGALTLLACLVVVYATPRDAFWILDGGTKSIVSQRMLEAAELSFDYPAAALDPEGVAFPIRPPFALRWRGDFVAFYPPAFSAISVPFLGFFGRAGLRFPAALGVAACAALFAVWLAPVMGRRRAALGGLVVAFATPLFFYGVTVWEHSLTVALPLAACVVLRPFSTPRLLLAGLLAASACWIREELCLMLLALAIACTLQRRRIADGVIFSLGAAPAVVGLLVFNWALFGHPLGLHVVGSVAGSAWASGFDVEFSAAGLARFLGSVGVQLGAVGAGAGEARIFALALVAIGLIGGIAARRRDWGTIPVALTLVLGLGAWLFGSSRILFGGWPMLRLVQYNGLLVQLPLFCLVVVGTAAVWRLPANARLRLGVFAGLLFLALEVAFRGTTQLFTGGQWGPRELLPALPAVVGVAGAAVQGERAADGSSGSSALGTGLLRLGGVALVSAGLLSTALSVWLLGQQKQEAGHLQQAILDAPTEVVLTTKSVLAPHLAAIFHQRSVLWVQDEDTFRRIAANLRSHGVDEFLLVTPADAAWPTGCSPWLRRRGRFVHYSDSDLFLCDVTRATQAFED